MTYEAADKRMPAADGGPAYKRWPADFAGKHEAQAAQPLALRERRRAGEPVRPQESQPRDVVPA